MSLIKSHGSLWIVAFWPSLRRSRAPEGDYMGPRECWNSGWGDSWCRWRGGTTGTLHLHGVNPKPPAYLVCFSSITLRKSRGSYNNLTAPPQSSIKTLVCDILAMLFHVQIPNGCKNGWTKTHWLCVTNQQQSQNLSWFNFGPPKNLLDGTKDKPFKN